MPKGKGYGTFEKTFGSQNKQPYDSTSKDNMHAMSVKSKKDAAYLRKSKLGNAARWPPLRKVDPMHRDGTTPKSVTADKVLVTTAKKGSTFQLPAGQSKEGARQALFD